MTVEGYKIGVVGMLYTTTDLCLDMDALAQWVKEDCKKNSDDRDFKKDIKKTVEFLHGKQVYYREKIKALKVIQGDKRLKEAFGTAIKVLGLGILEAKVESSIAIYNDLVRTTTNLCLKVDALAKWVKGGCKKKPDNNRDMKEKVKEIVKFLRELEAYYNHIIKALEAAQKNKKLKEEFETAVKILMEDKKGGK